MADVNYYLVCHETRTKVRVGAGEHTYKTAEFDAEALAYFFRDNLIFPLVVEWGHADIAPYFEYTGDAKADCQQIVEQGLKQLRAYLDKHA